MGGRWTVHGRNFSENSSLQSATNRYKSATKALQNVNLGEPSTKKPAVSGVFETAG